MRVATLLAGVSLLVAACTFDFARYRHAAGGQGGAGGEGSGGAGGSLSACGDGNGRCLLLPAGWNGPAWLQESADVTQPLACPDSLALGDLFRDLSASGNCNPCSCGYACAFPSFNAYPQAACGGNPSSFLPMVSCQNFPNGNQYSFTVPSGAMTACTPAGGEANLEPPTWGTRAVLCTAASLDGTCDAEGGACFSLGAPPLQASLCIWRDGEHACPPGFGALARTYYDQTGWLDNRACGGCACSATSQCSAQLRLHNQANCPAGFGEIVAAPSGCVDTNEKGSYRAEVISDGSCQVTQQATLSGSADPDPGAAHTVCCSD